MRSNSRCYLLNEENSVIDYQTHDNIVGLIVIYRTLYNHYSQCNAHEQVTPSTSESTQVQPTTTQSPPMPSTAAPTKVATTQAPQPSLGGSGSLVLAITPISRGTAMAAVITIILEAAMQSDHPSVMDMVTGL